MLTIVNVTCLWRGSTLFNPMLFFQTLFCSRRLCNSVPSSPTRRQMASWILSVGVVSIEGRGKEGWRNKERRLGVATVRIPTGHENQFWWIRTSQIVTIYKCATKKEIKVLGWTIFWPPDGSSFRAQAPNKSVLYTDWLLTCAETKPKKDFANFLSFL